jgi:hypothetical protein
VSALHAVRHLSTLHGVRHLIMLRGVRRVSHDATHHVARRAQLESNGVRAEVLLGDLFAPIAAAAHADPAMRPSFVYAYPPQSSRAPCHTA